jgi:hypothetical protein
MQSSNQDPAAQVSPSLEGWWRNDRRRILSYRDSREERVVHCYRRRDKGTPLERSVSLCGKQQLLAECAIPPGERHHWRGPLAPCPKCLERSQRSWDLRPRYQSVSGGEWIRGILEARQLSRPVSPLPRDPDRKGPAPRPRSGSRKGTPSRVSPLRPAAKGTRAIATKGTPGRRPIKAKIAAIAKARKVRKAALERIRARRKGR